MSHGHGESVVGYALANAPPFVISSEDVQSVRVTRPGDVRRAAEALHQIAMNTANMRVAVAHDIADKRTPVDDSGALLATEIFGWGAEADRAWWKNSRIALDSPIITACRYEGEPFWVNAQGFHTSTPNPYLNVIDLSNFEARAMTNAALVAPVHLPFMQIGAVSFNPLDRSRTDLSMELALYGDAFGLLARAFVSSYVSVMAGMRQSAPGSRLSKREVECLRWAAVGKTDLEISMIMARSRATVRFHIHNASLKLDAVNRSQTVFKAAQLGYISLTR